MYCINKKVKPNTMRKSSLVLWIFSITISFLGCKEEKKMTHTDKKVTQVLITDATDYEIVHLEDQSRKALGKKAFSQYETAEIEKLPINKKILYRVVLPKYIKERQVKPTVEKIIKELASVDAEIDEIILWLYSDKEISDGPYDIGTAIWAPNGKLGNVDADIAKNNNRESYKIEYLLKTNLDQYLTQKLDSNEKFGYTVEVRKQIFKEIVEAEDKAYKYDEPEQDKKLTEFKSKILSKYSLTIEQLKEITREGQDKYWPMD